MDLSGLTDSYVCQKGQRASLNIIENLPYVLLIIIQNIWGSVIVLGPNKILLFTEIVACPFKNKDGGIAIYWPYVTAEKKNMLIILLEYCRVLLAQ